MEILFLYPSVTHHKKAYRVDYYLLVYINDMKRILRVDNINYFADGTVLYVSGKNLNCVASSLNRELKYTSRWLKFKEIKLNIRKDKTHDYLYKIL